MNKRQKIILISGVVIILGGLLAWSIARLSKEETLKEVPNLPQTEWPRTIVIEESGSDYKKLTNQFDGYEITVPSNWVAPETAMSGGYGIVFDDMNLNIFVFSKIEDAKLIFPESARFVGTETSIGRAYKTTNKILGEDTFQNGEMVNLPIEDSLSTGYIIPVEEKIYVILCSAIGDNFAEMVSLCEKQVPTFKILR